MKTVEKVLPKTNRALELLTLVVEVFNNNRAIIPF